MVSRLLLQVTESNSQMLKLIRLFKLDWKRTAVFLLATSAAHSQLSSSAYRVLGQTNFSQNGLNMVQGVELNAPSAIALDARNGQIRLYIADTRNARVLAWPDVNSYQIGDAPALVLGQPGPQYSTAYGIGAKGFNQPTDLAVDPVTGNLYVADFGSNRVLRFPSPFANPSRIEPDAVYGQPNFTSFSAGASASSLNQPQAVAFDSSGNLWVADSGNNRVLRFSAAVLNNPVPPSADTVIGQADFVSAGANAGGSVSASGFSAPVALIFDAQNNLYVSDFNNARVLKFSAPLGPSGGNPAASGVWGQSNFSAHGIAQQASASTLSGPGGLAVDNNGNLYVAVPNDNRVLVFPVNTTPGAAAKSVLGQSNFTTTTANTGAAPLASQNTLFAPADVKTDQNGNIFVADYGNNRVLEFPSGTKSSTKVWGQTDFVSNGPNQIKPVSLSYPLGIAIDYSQSPFALYVSDTANNRVLIWKDSVRFQNGDPADLVIGQPNLRSAVPNVDTQGSQTPSSTSLSSPAGIVVNQNDGTVYLADSRNNRVLRFPRPVAQSGRITPDAVIGQVDFSSANSAAVSASSLNGPVGLALGPNGDLFVADNGNNRVLEFPAGAGNGASAVRIYGQPNSTASIRPSQMSAQTLANPECVFVDQASNLYVTDTGANRVLIFPNTQNAPPSGMAATFVIGQTSFSGATGGSGSGGFKVPVGVGVDSSGDIYVADSGNNRVLMFQPLVFLPVAGAGASAVTGQQTGAGTSPNWDSTNGLATADSLFSPAGVYLDRQDTMYVGDPGNNRLLQFLKPAAVVNAATFQASVPTAPGGLASLFGAGLVSGSATASGTTWPTTLMNRQIVVNDQLVAPLYTMGSSQSNFQIPSNTPLGTERIAVRVADTGELVAGGSLPVAAASPGLFTLSQQGSGQAAARNQDNSLNGSSNPAAVGSTISLYGTGQGLVSPSVLDGTATPLSPLSTTVAVPTSDPKVCTNSQPSVCVAIGTGFGNIQYSGLAPGFIGLWQINVTIPQGAGTGGAVPVRVVIDGAPSNIVTIAVK
jgi:uncharacterized protein (TIGR03437 family)